MNKLRITIRGMVVAMAAMLVVSLAAPAAQAVTRPEKDVAWRINHEHYKRSLRSLAVSESLSNTARAHSCAMANSNSLYHNRSLTKQVRGWRILGENVGMGHNLYEIHKAWMASPAHRDNVLEGRYRSIGIGICQAPSGALFVTTIFFR